MSQRDNRYRDFQVPNDFEEFKRMRAQMAKPQAPASPSQSPSVPASSSSSNRIPVSVSNSARSRNALLNNNNDMHIPLTSSGKSTADSASSRNQNMNSTTSNSPASSVRGSSSKPKVQIQQQPVVRNSSVASSSRSRSPTSTSHSQPETEGAPAAQLAQNPSRTRPPLQHQNSFSTEPAANKVSLHDVARSERQSRQRQNLNSVGNYSRESTPETSLTHGEWLAKKNQMRRSAERNSHPNDTRILKEKEFGWKNTDSLNSIPPNEFTISHINQHHDMLRLDDLKVAPEMNLCSTEWLQHYSLEFLGLTLKDLLAKGVISKPVSDKTGKAVQHITFDSAHVDEFEYKLNLSLEMYSNRIKWLMQSSKKLFGLVQGERVAVLVDTSETNMAFGRVIELQDSLVTLINEQLPKRKQLYFLNYGTDVNELWEDTLMDVHHRSIEEAKQYVTHLYATGGSNLLKAFKKASMLRDVDSILLIIGSVPDQNMDIIVDYMSQIVLNKKCQLHCVSFEFTNHIVNSALKKLAEESNGRFHCYSKNQEELLYNSTDVSMLLKEIQKTQDLLNRIKDMKQGTLGSAIVQIANEIQMELDTFNGGNYLPRPRGHDLPLNIEKAIREHSSLDWIQQHGLKAKKLNLYQILAPNAYNNKEYYIPVLNKTVTSQVHSKAMVQFPWHDGSTKNLHVDLAELYDYQKRLRSAVELYEKRIDWLSSGSRKIFGSVAEDSVCILIDCSQVNANYLIHIQHSLRLLLEQQMSSKKCFNLIAFGKSIKRWRPTVVKPTEILLQDAWKWVLSLKCSGTHNVMGAIRAALENEEERKHNIYVDGLYIFTSGMPDQSVDSIGSYLEESAVGRDLNVHTILFNVDDYDGNGPIPGRWANITNTAGGLRSLAHSTLGGRFHWFRETGIIESDDITEIQQEIERCIEFSAKACTLVESVKLKSCVNKIQECELADEFEQCDVHNRVPSKPCGPPRQTKTSMQRMKIKEEEQERQGKEARPWRPNSSKTEAVPMPYSNSRSNSSFSSRASTSGNSSSAKTEAFYVGGNYNTKGTVIRDFPEKKSIRKTVPTSIKLPSKEEYCSTKDWLKNYSLVKLKLDLHKLVAGPECKHNAVSNQENDHHVRYCTIFNHINVNGTMRHLQLNRRELNEYTNQCERVLKRYVKRLQWLLSGSRRVFGTFNPGDKCCILVDTSGSMDPFMADLKKELASLVWEQLFKSQISFNLIRFSDRIEKWREQSVKPTEDNCHKAIAWLANLNAHGTTCTLDALHEAFNDSSINSIYLISDGKPDNSMSMVLDEVKAMNAERNLKINTISFNCQDQSANMFLSQLAAEHRGRYHKCNENDREIQLFSHKILTEGIEDSFLSHIPEFEGDDLRRLAAEIFKAKQFLRQSIDYAKTYEQD